MRWRRRLWQQPGTVFGTPASIFNRPAPERARPLTECIGAVLARRGPDPDSLAQRVGLIPIRTRPLQAHRFGVLAQAVLRRHRLYIDYRSRSRGTAAERSISPQRLT